MHLDNKIDFDKICQKLDFPKGPRWRKNLKILESYEMRLQVFLSIRRTSGHQNYAFRPTK